MWPFKRSLMKFLFYILRKFNDGEPSNYEIKKALHSLDRMDLVNSVAYQAMVLKVCGFTYEEIAKQLKPRFTKSTFTKERIRQLIRKGCRIAFR